MRLSDHLPQTQVDDMQAALKKRHDTETAALQAQLAAAAPVRACMHPCDGLSSVPGGGSGSRARGGQQGQAFQGAAAQGLTWHVMAWMQSPSLGSSPSTDACVFRTRKHKRSASGKSASRLGSWPRVPALPRHARHTTSCINKTEKV